MFQDQEKIFTIRTLACDICMRYDSLLLTKKELENKVYNNSLHIGSKILSHGDHLRIVYFDHNAEYLGDTMSLNISSRQIISSLSSEYPFLEKSDVQGGIHRKMLSFFTKNNYTLAIIGPSMAGKTSLSMFLNSGNPERMSQRVNHPPTMGKSVKRFKLANNALTVIDLGGQNDFWQLWQQNIEKSDKVIFVIDGTANNIEETKSALKLTFSQMNSNQQLLIIFNKIDLYLEGYSTDFLSPVEVLNTIEVPPELKFWIVEASVYNGLVYNYADSENETPLSQAIVDFIARK